MVTWDMGETFLIHPCIVLSLSMIAKKNTLQSYHWWKEVGMDRHVRSRCGFSMYYSPWLLVRDLDTCNFVPLRLVLWTLSFCPVSMLNLLSILRFFLCSLRDIRWEGVLFLLFENVAQMVEIVF